MRSSPDPREVIESKVLSEDIRLELKRWTSDFIEPGRIGYQLALVSFNGGLTTQFPIDWENYSEQQIRRMYDTINSAEDFNRIRRGDS